MKRKLVCIHGHFYQPPRENAWLSEIARQESASPFHDWNERIDRECYGPNARARILGKDEVVDIVNNYARISFNFGPTLLSWLETESPQTYEAILAADVESRRLFGHGSAIAQVYNHVIMPLATPRDRRTQVAWGIADFRRRFGRDPEGMWLAETAVCMDSLRALAEAGIAFTILAPAQARRVLSAGGEPVVGPIDTSRPYRIDLGNSQSISVFFYDGALSQAVAFERLLSNGEGFAKRLIGAFKKPASEVELVNIATDGETYGHHHRFGEMALAYALRHLEREGYGLTNYASFLAANPPDHTVEIHERSAWSCAHGVGRWERDCGCRMDGSTNQAWRGPLRKALDAIAAPMDEAFEAELGRLSPEPWKVRDRYIDVILGREPGGAFVAEHLPGATDPCRLLDLLEMEHHRLLMYTSCGWFFDRVSGLETTQILQYAARAIELHGGALEAAFLTDLGAAKADGEGEISGATVYGESLLGRVSATEWGLAFGVASLFELPLAPCRAFELTETSVHTERRAERRFATGQFSLRELPSGRTSAWTFALVHSGGSSIRGGLAPEESGRSPRDWRALFRDEPPEALSEYLALLPHPIGSLRRLPETVRHDVVSAIVEEAVSAAEQVYRQVFRENGALLADLSETAVRPPLALAAASRVILEADLLRAFRKVPPDARAIRNLMSEAKAENVPLEETSLAFELGRAVVRTCQSLYENPIQDGEIGRLSDLLELSSGLPTFEPRAAQDLVWLVLTQADHPVARAVRENGRLGAFRELGKRLRLKPAS